MYLHWPVLRKALRVTFSRKHFHPVHAGWVVGLSVAFFVLRGGVLVCRGLDHILFGAFRRQPVRAPIFILGNPRSGTTFLHRLMSLDQRFTTMRLYQTIVPSVVLYRLVGAVRWLDDRLGRPIQRGVEGMSERAFKAWKGIHRTRLSTPEEDEQLFVYSLVTPVLTLLFPFFDDLNEWDYADRLDERARHRLMGQYVGSIRRHLFCEPAGRTLLVKNTSASGRLRCTLEAFPDMKVIHLIRHPYETIASLLSMYTATWNRLAPHVAADTQVIRPLAYLFCDYYRYRLEVLRELPSSQVVDVRYEDLVEDPAGTISRVYAALGLDVTSAFVDRLDDAVRKSSTYVSTHQYNLSQFGLTEDEIYSRLEDVFQEYKFDVAHGIEELEYDHLTS